LSDHLVTEIPHHGGEHLEAILPLVGDQNAKVMRPVHLSTPN
jgi:hypothetical protein